MLSIIGSLVSFLPNLFTTVNGVTSAISNERLKLIQAKTDQDKIASEERISSLQAKRDVLIAESGSSKLNGIVRACIGGSVAFLLAKLYIFDKALGQWTGGHTDSLDPNLWNVITATIAFYFLYEGAVNTARIIKS
mgnify:CR=1 FL=1